MPNQSNPKLAPQADDNPRNATSEFEWPAPEQMDGCSLSELVRIGLASQRTGTGPQKTWGQFLVETLIKQGADGNLRALQEIWTRLEGRPGGAKARRRRPLEVDDKLAQLILNYGRDETDTC
jgi:hypothetical protein